MLSRDAVLERLPQKANGRRSRQQRHITIQYKRTGVPIRGSYLSSIQFSQESCSQSGIT